MIDGMFCLDERVIYKHEMLPVVTLQWSEITGTYYIAARDRRTKQVIHTLRVEPCRTGKWKRHLVDTDEPQPDQLHDQQTWTYHRLTHLYTHTNVTDHCISLMLLTYSISSRQTLEEPLPTVRQHPVVATRICSWASKFCQCRCKILKVSSGRDRKIVI